ncbi:MAG: primosomal protein N' [Coriobacteriales bacterium]|nr:primosomal protein N' [Coriobacteriales bacterium]
MNAESSVLRAQPLYAQVVLDIPSRALERAYDYLVPPDLAVSAAVGCLVAVDFAHRPALGYITKLISEPTADIDTRKIKPLTQLLSSPFFDAQAVRLANWMSEEYLAPLSDCLRLFVPPGARPRFKKDTEGDWQFRQPTARAVDNRWVQLTAAGYDYQPPKAAHKQRAIIDALRFGAMLVADLALDVNQPHAALKALAGRGLVELTARRHFRGSQAVTDRSCPIKQLTAGQSQALAAIRALLDDTGHNTQDPAVSKRFVTSVQAMVAGQIPPQRFPRYPAAVLLDGITGSGKTEVYLQAIATVLQKGGSACVLVPEISLTPQTVSRFRARFGEQVAVLHSRLSAGERFDQWDLLRSGQAQVVVGARSALFAPLTNLRLIVIDEEHESSYKQGSSPRYGSRDVALKRAQLCGAVVVLGSATPSLESLAACGALDHFLYAHTDGSALSPASGCLNHPWQVHTSEPSDLQACASEPPPSGVSAPMNPVVRKDGSSLSTPVATLAQDGMTTTVARRHSPSSSAQDASNADSLSPFATPSLHCMSRILLPERVSGRPLPPVEVVNLSAEFHTGNRSMYSARLKQALLQTMKRREKAVLLLNRRGFAAVLLCRDCGFVPTCAHCDTSLTLHQQPPQLLCHYCDTRSPVPAVCPQCGSIYLRQLSPGTQFAADQLTEIVPKDTPIIRMDADSTRLKDGHQRRLEEFAAASHGVLLGTQMIAKGLDFAEVTLVGVLIADTALKFPDFRAAERTYQLLEQVAGRAGRAGKEGRVVVQTYWPEHVAIRAAAAHSRDLLLEQECVSRRLLNYPPFGRLANILVWGADQDAIISQARELGIHIAKNLPSHWQLLGPSPCVLAKRQDQYRWHLLLKAPPHAPLAQYLAPLLRGLRSPAGVNRAVDIDPQDLM